MGGKFLAYSMGSSMKFLFGVSLNYCQTNKRLVFVGPCNFLKCSKITSRKSALFQYNKKMFFPRRQVFKRPFKTQLKHKAIRRPQECDILSRRKFRQYSYGSDRPESYKVAILERTIKELFPNEFERIVQMTLLA